MMNGRKGVKFIFPRLPSGFLASLAMMSGNELIIDFLNKLTASLHDDSFVRLSLSGPVAPPPSPQKVQGRLVQLRGQPHLSFTFTGGAKHETRNFPLAELTTSVGELLKNGFHSALLATTRKDWQLQLSPKGPARLVAHRPAQAIVPERTHDQQKLRVLNDSARDWLQGLDILDASGQIRARMADKYRQIDRYLEIFSHLASECGWDRPAKPEEPDLVLTDMGCGKGYLTFGVWHLFHRVWKRNVRIVGVEARPELTAQTLAIAQNINATGLEFIAGTIESAPVPQCDALIALHACNTATDAAILRGIDVGARLIIVAPCCHQEVRPQLGKPEPLAPVLRQGLMAERMAEWTTDGLRMLFLEWAGYQVKAIEFVGSEHTPKNLMITAVKHQPAFADPTARQRIVALKEFFDLQHHALDNLLDRK